MSETVEDTELGQLIDTMIRQTGPMPLHAYIELCLSHPRLGYYRTAQPIGAAGDFITAPEISQMFGEMIGVFLAGFAAECYPDKPVELVELGPGRGTLMADLLRVLKGTAHTLTLMETSEALIEEQHRRLEAFNPRWIAGTGEIDEDGPPLLVVANEFFDALPIRQYQKAADGWHEREVGLIGGRRGFGLSPTPIPASALPGAASDAETGAIFEINPLAGQIVAALTERIAHRGGVLLAIDYGYDKSRAGDTFQAMRRHGFADPLQAPGRTDLTAHVDFEALASSRAAGTFAHPLMTQADFLKGMGIDMRADALMRANPARAEALRAERDRLTGSEQMGTLFRVLCLTASPKPPYPFGADQ